MGGIGRSNASQCLETLIIFREVLPQALRLSESLRLVTPVLCLSFDGDEIVKKAEGSTCFAPDRGEIDREERVAQTLSVNLNRPDSRVQAWSESVNRHLRTLAPPHVAAQVMILWLNKTAYHLSLTLALAVYISYTVPPLRDDFTTCHSPPLLSRLPIISSPVETCQTKPSFHSLVRLQAPASVVQLPS